MSEGLPPEGWVPFAAGRWRGWVRADLREAAAAAGLHEPEGLAARALATHRGRGEAWTIPLGELRGVYRRYRHGGRLRHLTGERYLGRRSLAEARALTELGARGAPVPEPLVALEEPAGLPGLRRLALVTREIDGARPAPEALAALGRSEVTGRRRLLARLGRAVRAFHDAGGDHPDLNARNLVLDARGKAWVLDLDRATVSPRPATARVRIANLRRLARSWRKLDPAGEVVSPRDALAFARAYAGGRLRGLPQGAPGAPRAAAIPAAWLYDALLWALAPLLLAALPLLWLRGRYRRSWRQQLGVKPPPVPAGGRPILVHGASVGEAVAATPLIQELRRVFPGVPVVLSTLSESGQDAARRGGAADAYAFLPPDVPWARGRWLDHLAPRLAIFLETEIWAGHYRALWARGIPLATANARIAPNRVARYRRLAALYGPLLSIPDYQGVQSEQDRERVLSLGAPPARVHVAGDLKFDQVLANLDAPGRAALAPVLAGETPRLVAGSVHPGEAEEVLDAFQEVRRRHPAVRLTIAPRHLDKVPGLLCALDVRKLPWARRSECRAAPAEPVLVLDTHGELALCYEGARAAFVGGSLVPVGGHSPLEPAVFRVPVSFGPEAFNFRTMNELLAEGGGAREVADAAALAEEWCRLLVDEELARRRGEAAFAALSERGGAGRRVAGDLRNRWPGL